MKFVESVSARVKLVHWGCRCIVKNQFASDFVRRFIDDAVDNDGSANYCEVPSGSFGRFG
jgi:hypothetical protein